MYLDGTCLVIKSAILIVIFPCFNIVTDFQGNVYAVYEEWLDLFKFLYNYATVKIYFVFASYGSNPLLFCILPHNQTLPFIDIFVL